MAYSFKSPLFSRPILSLNVTPELQVINKSIIFSENKCLKLNSQNFAEERDAVKVCGNDAAVAFPMQHCNL